MKKIDQQLFRCVLLKEFRLLLEQGANPKVKDALGSPLSHKLYQNPLLFEKLCAVGFDVDATNRTGETLLHLATNTDGLGIADIDVMSRVLKLGANRNFQDQLGNTPLHYAPSWSAAEVLLVAGADPNLQNTKGETKLHLVLKLNHGCPDRWFELLCRHGANPLLQDREGKSPLDYADSSVLPLIRPYLAPWEKARMATQIPLPPEDNLPPNGNPARFI